MSNSLKTSNMIREEADNIIYQHGLKQLLSEYGTANFTGSYALDLMLKKDLDISLVNPSLSLESFFELGHRLATLLQPHSIHYRNTRVKPIADRPRESLYWALLFEDWNIDLWLVPEYYYLESEKYLGAICAALTPEKRTLILDIKTQAMSEGIYNKQFGSRELYQAVCFEEVHSYFELQAWLTKSADIET